MFLFNSPKVLVEVIPKGSILYVILDHKSSLKSKIIRILSKDHGSFRYFVNFLP